MSELSRLRVYLPPHVVRDFFSSPKKADGSAELSGAFLFADISGFTALSEKLAGMGMEGAERIAGEISRCFEPLLHVVSRFGGSVIRFGGDALLVYFADADNRPAQRAWAAASEMLRAFRKMKPVALPRPHGSIKLGIKVALHAGHALGLTAHLGDDRKEYVTLGTDFNRLAECESAGERWQIIASQAFIKDLKDFPSGRQTKPTVILSMPAHSIRNLEMPREAPQYDRSRIPAAVRWMSGFLPEAVAGRQAVLGGRTEWMAEIRRITVMFVNVDGLGKMADQGQGAAVRPASETPALGAAERLIRKIESYLAAVRSTAQLHGGFFFATDLYDVGDKLILIFGAPVSFERDEERAIDAARDILKLPAKLGLRFRTRIGLNSGSAFCGLVGGNARRVYTVMGDTVNTAARCMSASPWGQMYVHENTFLRARGRFEGPKRQFAAKGKSLPVTIYAVRQERSGVAAGAASAGDLIGREVERRRVESLFSSKKGFLLNLVGEAGVGKSTLLGFAVQLWQSEGGRTVSADCLPYGLSTPFLPLRRAIWNYFEFGSNPTAAVIRRALRGVSPEDAAILAEMIGVDIGLRPPRMDAKRALERRLEVFRRIVEKDPRTIWVFEDIHWMDANSVQLLRRLASSGTSGRLLFTQRPERDIFPNASTIVTLTLNPFSVQETTEMARRHIGDGVLGDRALKDIHTRSNGNPFFLTEIFRLILDRGRGASLPDSVQALLQSRVDRLPETDRLMLRAAAVIGRIFFADLLKFISPVTVTIEQLAEALKRLEAAGFVCRLAPLRYEFRHALSQESVYEGVPAELRRRLHRRIADRLERRRQKNVDLVAYHYDRAGSAAADKAIRYLDAAGRRAQGVYANEDAIRLYTRALHWLNKETDDARAAEIYSKRADVLKTVGKFTQARADYLAASRLFLRMGNRAAAALERDSAGVCLQREGRHAEAVTYSEQALRILHRQAARPIVRAKCLNSLTIAHWYMGNYAKAIEYGESSIRIRKALNDPRQMALGLFTIGKAYTAVCDLPKALSCFGELLKTSQTVNDLPGVAYAFDGLGQCYRKLGRYAEAIRHHRRSFQLREKTGNRRSIVYSCLNEAMAYLSMGLPQMALSPLNRSEEFLKETEEENLMGELWRCRGIAALRINELYRASICLERALRIAQASGFRESEINALAPLVQVTTLLGDHLRAAALHDRLDQQARQANLRDYIVWAEITAGDLAVRQKDRTLTEESWRNAADLASRLELAPLLLEIAARWRKHLSDISPPEVIASPETIVLSMAEGLEESDRRAFEACWGVWIEPRLAGAFSPLIQNGGQDLSGRTARNRKTTRSTAHSGFESSKPPSAVR